MIGTATAALGRGHGGALATKPMATDMWPHWGTAAHVCMAVLVQCLRYCHSQSPMHGAVPQPREVGQTAHHPMTPLPPSLLGFPPAHIDLLWIP